MVLNPSCIVLLYWGGLKPFSYDQSQKILIQLAWSGYFLKGPIVVLIHSCVENHWSGLELDYQKI